MHFYAGVLVGPFILIAALTGALYALAPTIEKVVYSDVLSVESTGDPALPIAAQVAAAQDAHPDLTVVSVQPGASATATTRVNLQDPSLGVEELRSVFVDPYTGSVLGAEPTWWGALPFSTWVDILHRDLHLGAVGNLYSEVAASWLWVVALGGLFLWWAKFRKDKVRDNTIRNNRARDDKARGRRARFFTVDRSVRGRARTLNWHGAAGLWILVMLLFLSATGITWSPYAGEHVSELRAAMAWERPQLTTSLTGEAPDGGEHSGHGGDHSGGAAQTDNAGLDLNAAAAAAEGAGVEAPVEISLPSEPGQALTVSEMAAPYRFTTDSAAIDPATMQVSSVIDYNADYSLIAKFADWGIRGHMGTLFGLLNQLLLLAVALVLVTIIIRGYRMWWQRRPTRGTTRRPVGRPPVRGGLRRAPTLGVVVLAIVAVAVGWFLPVLGVTLLAFLVLDAMIGFIDRARAPGGSRQRPVTTEPIPSATTPAAATPKETR
ncbi:PepSY-associated TM helix domain-containing protein [Gordonia terrae]